MASRQPNPPEYGQGPANFANQADAGPFSAFDNTINYQNMMRYQMVTQYQQQQTTPYNLPPSMQRKILTDPRYSYGVPEGQNSDYYNRQSELNRTAYSGAITTGALGMGAWSAAGAAMAAAKFGGMTAFGGSMLLSAPITAMISNRVNETMERQKYMHSIALDLRANREKLGMSGLSYDEASALGGSLAGMMMEKTGTFGQKQAGFFNAEQMSRIHKIGVSGGLINAAGPRSGTIGQYEKNFKELVKTTEDIVKVLNTTIEGGMSIIKEMNQIGFTTLPQIRSQIKGAKAIGGATGLGFQNTMQLGAAGAQAVQGTPWNASVGASMYQMGAVAASTMAGASRQAAYAVDRVGGVAQAGAVIANAQMNILQSGIGTRIAAYAMNPDGSMNQGRLNAMLSSRVSAYQTVSGANNTGYAMGQDRVRFGMFKADMLNNLSDTERAGLTRQAFRMWGSERYGSLENKAYVFAKNYTNTDDAARVMYESLLGSSGYNRIAGQSAMNSFIGADAVRTRAQMGPGMARAVAGVQRNVITPIQDFTDVSMEAMSAGTSAMGRIGKWASRDVGLSAANWAMKTLEIGDKYGMFGGANYGNTADAARYSYGMATRGNINQDVKALAAIKMAGDITIPTRKAIATGIDWKKVISDRSPAEMNKMFQDINTAMMGGSAGKEFKYDNNTRRILEGYPAGAGISADQYLYSVALEGSKYVNSIKSNYRKASGEYDDWFARKSATEQAGINSKMESARYQLRMSGGDYKDVLDKNGKAVGMRIRGQEISLDSTARNLLVKENEYNTVRGINVVDPTKVNYPAMAAESAQKVQADILKYSGGAYDRAAGIQRMRGIGAGFMLGGLAIAGTGVGVGVGALSMGVGGTIMALAPQIENWIGKKEDTRASSKFLKKEFGVNVKSGAEFVKFAEDLANVQQEVAAFTGSQAEFDKSKLKKRAAFAETDAGRSIVAQGRMLGGARALQAFEGLANQGKAMGYNVSAQTFQDIAFDPVKAAGANIQSLMGMTGQTEEGVMRLAKIKGEGGLLSQLFAQKVGAIDQSFSSRAAAIKGNLASLAGYKNENEKLKSIVIDGMEYSEAKKNAISVDKAKALSKEARENLMMEMAAGKSDTKGGGNTASVASPIMNYWNNRWIL